MDYKIYLVLILIATLAITCGITGCTKAGVDKGHNWKMELTYPLGYEVEIQDVFYRRNNKAITRGTNKDLGGWEGYSGGTVLYNKRKELLPDSVSLVWKEVKSGIIWRADFAFPAQEALTYYQENYTLQKKKWGNDYPEGKYAFKLGMAPGGFVALWLTTLDDATSGVAMEIANFQAVAERTELVEQVGEYANRHRRAGDRVFYLPESPNTVSLYVRYLNGESEAINQKLAPANSILIQENKKRGWAIAKTARISWFNEANQGFWTTYASDSTHQHRLNTVAHSSHRIVYLLGFNELPASHVPEPNEIVLVLDKISEKPIGQQ